MPRRSCALPVNARTVSKPRCRTTPRWTRASSGALTMGRSICTNPDIGGARGGAGVAARGGGVENLLSIRYLGDEDGPAPRLKDVRLEAPEATLEAVLEG